MSFWVPFNNPVGVDQIMQCIEHIAWRTEGNRHRKWLIATRQYIKTSERVREPQSRTSGIAPVEWFITRRNDRGR